IRALKALYRPVLGAAVRAPFLFVGGALLLFVGAGVLFTRLGTEFIPQLDEKSIALNATRIPSTSLTQSQTMQLNVERAVSKFPQVAYV
ncbi:efflux RND transporter permease subunit, partial [Rhizobium johnstonii]